jgi:hypothetical protein
MWISILALMLASITLFSGGVYLVTRRRHFARQIYQKKLESALADGILTPEEVAELDHIRAEKELTQAEVRMVARAIYRGALREVLEDERLSHEEDQALRALQVQLGLSEADLGSDLTHLSRLRMLARVETGDLPIVDSPIALVPQERCHWVVQCTLADELDLPRSVGSEISGIRLNVLGSERFSAEGERDELRPNERILPTDIGILAVTTRRTVFQGAKRTISIPHARLEGITLHADGLRMDEIGGSTRGYLLVDDAELTTAILLQAARRRRTEIRPTRSGLSA